MVSLLYFAWKRASGLSLQETAITANHHMVTNGLRFDGTFVA